MLFCLAWLLLMRWDGVADFITVLWVAITDSRSLECGRIKLGAFQSVRSYDAQQLTHFHVVLWHLTWSEWKIYIEQTYCSWTGFSILCILNQDFCRYCIFNLVLRSNSDCCVNVEYLAFSKMLTPSLCDLLISNLYCLFVIDLPKWKTWNSTICFLRALWDDAAFLFTKESVT